MKKSDVNAINFAVINSSRIFKEISVSYNENGNYDSIVYETIEPAYINDYTLNNSIVAKRIYGSVALNENSFARVLVRTSEYNSMTEKLVVAEAFGNRYYVPNTNERIETFKDKSWKSYDKKKYKQNIGTIEYQGDEISKISTYTVYAKGKSTKKSDLQIVETLLQKELLISKTSENSLTTINQIRYKYSYNKDGVQKKSFVSKFVYNKNNKDQSLIKMEMDENDHLLNKEVFYYEGSRISKHLEYNANSEITDSIVFVFNANNYVTRINKFKAIENKLIQKTIEEFSYTQKDATKTINFLNQHDFKRETLTTVFDNQGNTSEQYNGTKKRRMIDGQWSSWQQLQY